MTLALPVFFTAPVSYTYRRYLLNFSFAAHKPGRYAANIYAILCKILFDNKLQCIYNVVMKSLSFSWDNRKNKSNQKKHAVSFEEAQTVFFDENAIEYFDPDHSDGEDRFIMLGLSSRLRILVVCHCIRENDSEIRIISARKATKKERKVYTGGKV